MDTRRKKLADAMAVVESGVPTHIEQLQKMLEMEQRRRAMEALGVAPQGAVPQGLMPDDMGGSPTTPLPPFEGEPRGAAPIGPQVGEPAKPVPLPNVRPMDRKIKSRATLYQLMR